MADYFVDRSKPIMSNDEFKWIAVACHDDIRADGFGKTPIVQGRRIGIPLDSGLVHYCIYLVGGYTRFYGCGCDV